MSVHRRQFIAAVAAAGAGVLGRSTDVTAQARRRRYSKPVFDAHFHWYPPEFGELIVKEGAANGVTEIRQDGWDISAKIPGTHPYSGGGRASFRRQNMTDVAMMLKMADGREVDISVVTQTNPHVQWANAAFGAKLARGINDGN